MYKKLQQLSNNSAWLVECFFIIAGYFMYVSIKNNENWLNYTFRRFFRLWSVLAFSVVISVIFFNRNMYACFFDLSFLQCIGLSSEYKGINWYISPFFFGSLFIYGIYSTIKRNKAYLIVAVIVYFSYLANVNYTGGSFSRETVYGVVNLALARALAGIGLGTLLAGLLEIISTKYNNQLIKIESKIINKIIFTIFEFSFFSLLIFYTLLGGEYNNHIILVIWFVVLFICFSLNIGYFSNLFNRRVFGNLAKYCYSIYVMQQISFGIMQKTFWNFPNLITNVFFTMICSITFSVFLGIMTYYLIEKPFYSLYYKIKNYREEESK